MLKKREKKDRKERKKERKEKGRNVGRRRRGEKVPSRGASYKAFL